MGEKLSRLFTAFRGGDRDAFSELYRLTINQLIRYGTVICSDRQLVENTTQEFYLRMLQEPEKLDHVINFKLYLFKSIKQNLLREMNKQQRRAVILQMASAPPVPEPSRERQLIDEEVDEEKIGWLKSQLDSLPTRQKEVIFLRFYEGFTYSKIAEITSLSSQVARNYVARALKKMRQDVNSSAASNGE